MSLASCYVEVENWEMREQPVSGTPLCSSDNQLVAQSHSVPVQWMLTVLDKRNAYVLDDCLTPGWQVVWSSKAFLAAFDATNGISSLSLSHGGYHLISAVGIIARDHYGAMVACHAIPLNGGYAIVVAEANAITYGIQLAVELQFAHVWIESDATNVVRQLTSSHLDISTVGFHLAQT
ncbi:hypothetical protein F3Y22_tig00111088pilonHSYRG00147 [Hibiscus syriacus]|uniref:RNase H type-1 domain-containing protein n=1 Tax=Hibiscus syriacus TaxID=106335 RepID=A0A6A2Z1Y0_HIBSY|nr:hypothetical protein F3Y22_tig00111088pilonHSYRG00147 [Hibiscus syriacus]